VTELVGGRTTRLGKFLRLPSAERWLAAEAVLVLAMIRIGLWLLPLRRLQRIIAHATRGASSGGQTDESFPKRAGRAVARASAYIPRATCLPQALVVQFLLERRGYTPDLRIGMGRGAQRQLEGHAWVEHGGEVVFGAGFPAAQVVLSGLEGDRPNEG